MSENDSQQETAFLLTSFHQWHLEIVQMAGVHRSSTGVLQQVVTRLRSQAVLHVTVGVRGRKRNCGEGEWAFVPAAALCPDRIPKSEHAHLPLRELTLFNRSETTLSFLWSIRRPRSGHTETLLGETR